MTIQIKKRHYQIPRNSIQLVYVRKSGMWTVFENNKNFLQYMKRYKCKSVYGWYTKVIWITGFQKLRYTFRYTISLVSERYTNKKRRIKSYTDLFSLLCRYWNRVRWQAMILHLMAQQNHPFCVGDKGIHTTTVKIMSLLGLSSSVRVWVWMCKVVQGGMGRPIVMVGWVMVWLHGALDKIPKVELQFHCIELYDTLIALKFGIEIFI